MLVLSRKIGEEIMIGDDIRLVVYRIQGNRVRLGIMAPEGVPVFRSELLENAGEQDDRRYVLKAR